MHPRVSSRDRAELRSRAATACAVSGLIGRRVDRLTARTFNMWPAARGLPVDRGTRTDRQVLVLVLDSAQTFVENGASVSLTTVDQLGGDQLPYCTAVATGLAAALDAVQYESREGPCIEAVELDLVACARADDLSTAEAARLWPDFAKQASALGVRSALSIAVPWTAIDVGLQADQRALGAINFYAGEAHAFDDAEVYARKLSCWAGSVVTGRTPAEINDQLL